jgi:hypothetical protein
VVISIGPVTCHSDLGSLHLLFAWLSKIAYWRLSLFWLSVLSPRPGVLCFVVGCGVKRDSGLGESRGTLACRAKSTNGSPVSRP